MAFSLANLYGPQAAQTQQPQQAPSFQAPLGMPVTDIDMMLGQDQEAMKLKQMQAMGAPDTSTMAGKIESGIGAIADYMQTGRAQKSQKAREKEVRAIYDEQQNTAAAKAKFDLGFKLYEASGDPEDLYSQIKTIPKKYRGQYDLKVKPGKEAFITMSDKDGDEFRVNRFDFNAARQQDPNFMVDDWLDQNAQQTKTAKRTEKKKPVMKGIRIGNEDILFKDDVEIERGTRPATGGAGGGTQPQVPMGAYAGVEKTMAKLFIQDLTKRGIDVKQHSDDQGMVNMNMIMTDPELAPEMEKFQQAIMIASQQIEEPGARNYLRTTQNAFDQAFGYGERPGVPAPGPGQAQIAPAPVGGTGPTGQIGPGGRPLLNEQAAAQFFKEAGGNPTKARELAAAAGFEWQ